MKNYKIKDANIEKLHQEYRNKIITDFRDEYRISDKDFAEKMQMLTNEKYKLSYEILLNSNKLIFDKSNDNEIIVMYTKDDIIDLVEILKCNNIKCNADSFKSYIWVKFDRNAIMRLGNTMPMNENCKIFSFDEFVSEFGF